MTDIFLCRYQRGDQGTEGRVFGPGISCYSIEPPWRDNQTGVSCIPPGVYTVKVRFSRKYGRVYWVVKVEGRTYILIHSGNWAGDKSLGYRSHSEGCILLGLKRGRLMGQQAVLNSRMAVDKFVSVMKHRDFRLNVMEVFSWT